MHHSNVGLFLLVKKGGIVINKENTETTNKIVEELQKLGFGGSELDAVKETILSVLNNKDMFKMEELADYFTKGIEEVLIKSYKDELNFDFVYDKVYSLFNDPILCEKIFDNLQINLEEKYEIDMRHKDI